MGAYPVPIRRARLVPQRNTQYEDEAMLPPDEENYYQPPPPPPAPAYDAGGPQTYDPDLTTTDPYERFTDNDRHTSQEGNSDV
jgi:hypothetical protein